MRLAAKKFGLFVAAWETEFMTFELSRHAGVRGLVDALLGRGSLAATVVRTNDRIRGK